MTIMGFIEGTLAFLFAFFIGTLIEYGVHRLMHAGKFLHKKHAKHHQAAQGQGWLGEFKDYFLPGVAIIWAGFLFSWAAGIGFAFGCFAYACLAAYAHQLQHENPDLVFWLPRPVHHLHHNNRMWHHNFGILVDFWDRVFGTYKKVDYEPRKKRSEYTFSSYFKIRWF
jgi:sterol desaturase/sphingolipid hydroxylase (fatty acid hydroxylase superfamily)